MFGLAQRCCMPLFLDPLFSVPASLWKPLIFFLVGGEGMENGICLLRLPKRVSRVLLEVFSVVSSQWLENATARRSES